MHRNLFYSYNPFLLGHANDHSSLKSNSSFITQNKFTFHRSSFITLAFHATLNWARRRAVHHILPCGQNFVDEIILRRGDRLGTSRLDTMRRPFWLQFLCDFYAMHRTSNHFRTYADKLRAYNKIIISIM